MTLRVSGFTSFDGRIDAACHADQPGVVTVEGKGNDYFLRFHVHEPQKGTHAIVTEGLTSPTPSHVRFDVLRIGAEQYVVPAGEAAVDEADGRAGTLRARRFTKSGGRLEPIDLAVQATWSCR